MSHCKNFEKKKWAEDFEQKFLGPKLLVHKIEKILKSWVVQQHTSTLNKWCLWKTC